MDGSAGIQQNILGAEVEFIPAGYNPVLQAMDKGLHKPFKQPEGGEPSLDSSTARWCQTYLTTYISVDCKRLGA